MKRNLSFHEKVHWALACNEIENEFAQHCFYHGNGEQRPGYATSVKWSEREDLSGTHRFGALLGRKGIDNWTAGMFKAYDAAYERLVEAFPDVEGMNHGQLAEFAMHTLASPIIEVSGDCMTAKVSFYTPGVITCNRNSNGQKFGLWLWERYGEDWSFEKVEGEEYGEWRVLHNMVSPDCGALIDAENWAEAENHTLEYYGVIDCGSGGPEGIDIPGPSHVGYSPVQVPQADTNPWPEPYECLDDPGTPKYIPKPGHGQPYVVVFEGAPGDPRELIRGDSMEKE